LRPTTRKRSKGRGPASAKKSMTNPKTVSRGFARKKSTGTPREPPTTPRAPPPNPSTLRHTSARAPPAPKPPGGRGSPKRVPRISERPSNPPGPHPDPTPYVVVELEPVFGLEAVVELEAVGAAEPAGVPEPVSGAVDEPELLGVPAGMPVGMLVGALEPAGDLVGEAEPVESPSPEPPFARELPLTCFRPRTPNFTPFPRSQKKARMERNRVSAARHRQSQRDLIESLKQQLAAVQTENDRLKQGMMPDGYTLVKIEPAVFF